jgi:hypothetical protein
MATVQHQQPIKDLLERLSTDKLDALKELFWSRLSYNRQNTSFPTRDWSEELLALCDTTPVVFATAGFDHQFGIIYAQLSGDLRLTIERQLVMKMLQTYQFGLFIFSNQAQTHWHFVNVKLDDGRDHTRRRIFRRITISPDERLRTASERIAILDLQVIGSGQFPEMPGALYIQQVHDTAFDVEKVTDDFFKKYTIIFREFQDMLESQTHDKVWAHDYALQFLNRLLFLYYIQRKRWLGEIPEFLFSFWHAYQDSKQPPNTFVSQWLQVMFFEAFNHSYFVKPYFPDEINQALAEAPFLNGGLFAENELDHDYHVDISDDAFRKLFNFLESYNFTISEDTPLDQEVAVDPEMIGRVYESLVNISDDTSEQSDAGIYYTPRIEIDLMGRLALVDWLKNYLGEDKNNLLYQWVFAFTPEDKSTADLEVQNLNLWPLMQELLESVTVLDPACGSGSFLVGMLYILNDLLNRADNNLGISRTPYQRKKAIIANSLYGVDIKTWAAHISELRLWLQLVVETELPFHERQLNALLPNLSFKIRAGDSLVQQIGGIDLNLNRARGQYVPELGGRLNQLKAEKLKFFHNDPTRRYQTAELIWHEERRLFRDLLIAQIHSKENERTQLAIQLEDPTNLFGEVVRPQLTLDRPQAEQEVHQLTEELAQLHAAKEELDRTTQVPFVWDIAFVEIFEGPKRGFDLVIGNPPYLRQEEIHDPTMDGAVVTTDQKREYKSKLAASVYAAWPKTFGYDPRDASVAWALNRKSDYYIYFYFHGLSLLNESGSFCFITSNSWLDVEYGKDFQKFLLTRGKVHFIIDNQIQRSFGRADVNTVIVLLGPAKDSPATRRESLNSRARFVMFKVPFERVLSPVIWQELVEKGPGRCTMEEYRLIVQEQQTLYQNGLDRETGDYAADKWGGKYLRSPEIYWKIIEKAGDKLVRLGDIADVRFGIKTGANDFFYLDEEKIAQWGIEEEYLKPVLRSTREIESIYINESLTNYKIFICHKPKSGLSGTNALRYIEWGEEIGFNLRPSCQGRRNWYDLGTQAENDFIVLRFRDKRNWTPLINQNLLIGDVVFVGKYFNRVLVEVGNAILNSTLQVFMSEVFGRVNLGDGLLTLYGPEIKILPLISPELLIRYKDELVEKLDTVSQRPVLQIFDEVLQEDKKALDKIIFEVLELNDSEISMVYDATLNLVQKRISKAESR